MKCPNCNQELFFTLVSEIRSGETKFVQNYCKNCHKKFSERELQDIIDAEKIEEDMKFWKESQKYK